MEYDAQASVEFLLQHGVRVDWKSSEGETALHLACMHSRTAILETLMQHKADGNLCSLVTKASPYHMAIQRAGLDVIDILARNGADINQLDNVCGL